MSFATEILQCSLHGRCTLLWGCSNVQRLCVRPTCVGRCNVVMVMVTVMPSACVGFAQPAYRDHERLSRQGGLLTVRTSLPVCQGSSIACGGADARVAPLDDGWALDVLAPCRRHVCAPDV